MIRPEVGGDLGINTLETVEKRITIDRNLCNFTPVKTIPINVGSGKLQPKRIYHPGWQIIHSRKSKKAN